MGNRTVEPPSRTHARGVSRLYPKSLFHALSPIETSKNLFCLCISWLINLALQTKIFQISRTRRESSGCSAIQRVIFSGANQPPRSISSGCSWNGPSAWQR